jgi:hypothetical protein
MPAPAIFAGHRGGLLGLIVTAWIWGGRRRRESIVDSPAGYRRRVEERDDYGPPETL